MTDQPLCPNCGRPMKFSRVLDEPSSNEEEVNVFRCPHCNVSFITEDHLPIAGVRVH